MNYIPKYLPNIDYHNRPKGLSGIKPKFENWCSDSAIIERDTYYGFLKHRSQAKYRSEEHTLTVANWTDLWTEENWLRRGKTRHSLCLMQIDPEAGWHINNVKIVERIEYLQRAAEYKAKNQ
jgi:hypothetical protein|tara:strand:+ start:2563 stop:2928 length:366 start_codon:yes stop_codon:yes gene_type:complete